MKKAAWIVILICLCLFWLGFALAIIACDPDTGETVSYTLMGLASILGVTSIFGAFGGFLILEDMELYK